MRLFLSTLAVMGLCACGSPDPGAGAEANGGITLQLAPPKPFEKEAAAPAEDPSNEVAPLAVDEEAAEANTQAPAEERETPDAEANQQSTTAQQSADENPSPPPAAPREAAADPQDSAMRPGPLPLPNAQVARTIDRIGFACGEVVSSGAVGTQRGIYKINCSSGEAYQGTMKGGRLFFRPWTGRVSTE